MIGRDEELWAEDAALVKHVNPPVLRNDGRRYEHPDFHDEATFLRDAARWYIDAENAMYECAGDIEAGDRDARDFGFVVEDAAVALRELYDAAERFAREVDRHGD